MQAGSFLGPSASAIGKILSQMTDKPVEIHWFNETTHFSSGNNYRMDEPDYLLINNCIENINMWDRKDPLVRCACTFPKSVKTTIGNAFSKRGLLPGMPADHKSRQPGGKRR